MKVLVVAREVQGKCPAGIHQGDVTVLDGSKLIKEESGPICINALSVIALYIHQRERWPKWFCRCPCPGLPYSENGPIVFEVIAARCHDICQRLTCSLTCDHHPLPLEQKVAILKQSVAERERYVEMFSDNQAHRRSLAGLRAELELLVAKAGL